MAKIKFKFQLKEKLALFIGLLLVATILLSSIISYINMDRAYSLAISAKRQDYDSKIKAVAESMTGVLSVNHQRYLSGEITKQEALESAEKIIRDTRYNGDGYFWAYTEDGTCIVHMDPEIEGTQRYGLTDQEGNYYVRNIIAAGNRPGGGYTDYYTKKPGQEGLFQKRTYTLKFEPYGWYINAGNYAADIEQAEAAFHKQEASAQAILLAVSFGNAIIGVLIAFFGLKRLTGPLAGVAKRLEQLAAGDAHTPPVPVTKDRDELQTLTQATETLILTIRGIVEDLTRHMGNMAKGDLTTHFTHQYVGDFAPIQESLQQAYLGTAHALSNINTSADMVNSGAAQISDAAQALASGATEQAASVQELSASIATVSGEASHIAESVKQASESVAKTATGAEEGQEKMERLLASMERIKDSSNQINGIADTIQDIAQQTNILALNAAIEAARAGTAGKGFAVVAEEVRNLAGQSAASAKKTAELIERSMREVDEGLRLAQETRVSTEYASGEISGIQRIMESIAGDVQGQAAAITQITSGMEQISTVVQTNAATAEESSASSEELSAQAAILKDAVSTFKYEDVICSSETAPILPYDGYDLLGIQG